MIEKLLITASDNGSKVVLRTGDESHEFDGPSRQCYAIEQAYVYIRALYTDMLVENRHMAERENERMEALMRAKREAEEAARKLEHERRRAAMIAYLDAHPEVLTGGTTRTLNSVLQAAGIVTAGLVEELQDRGYEVGPNRGAGYGCEYRKV